MALSDIQPLVRTFAKVASTLVSQGDNSDESRAITNALRDYSKRCPRQLTKFHTSTGGQTYDLTAIISGWDEDTHTLKAVRRSGCDRPIDPRNWDVVQTEDGWVLRFLGDPPTAGVQLDLQYLGPRTIDTVPPGDWETLAHQAAGYVLEIAANLHIPQTSSTMRADSVQQEQLRQAYLLQSREERKIFDDAMERKPIPSSLVVDIDTAYEANSFFRYRR